jgi:hypothetical protein
MGFQRHVRVRVMGGLGPRDGGHQRAERELEQPPLQLDPRFSWSAMVHPPRHRAGLVHEGGVH